jgi:Phytanoyl-CoA dioxygenase (PhyH)
VGPVIGMRWGAAGWHPGAVLTTGEVESFVADGFVAIRGAVPGEVIAACQQVIWAELAKQGVTEDPASWTEPVVRVSCPEGGPFVAAGTQPVVWEACDQLIGPPERWWRRPGVGGSLAVRFPSERDPGDAGWHIESSYAEDGNPWVNCRSRARGLLALYLLTDVDEASAPTRLRPGSHLEAARVLAPAGDAGMPWLEAAQAAAAATEHLPTVLATGRAGDVFLCHPFLVHAASWPHRGTRPRVIAQPGVALHDQFPLTAPLSPVERAIVAGGQSKSAAGS